MKKFKEDSVCKSNLKTKITEIWPEFPEEFFNEFMDFTNMPTNVLVQLATVELFKPYGKNYILKINQNYGFSFVQIYPGQSTSFHYHSSRREFFTVRQGQLKLSKGDNVTFLHQHEFGFSTPCEAHSLGNTSADLLEIVEIFSPAMLDDKVRVADGYDRKLGDVIRTE